MKNKWLLTATGVLVSLFAVSCSAGGVPQQGREAEKIDPPAKAAASLRMAAEQRGFFVGAAVNYSPFKSDAEYRKVLAEQVNIITPENEMKFAKIHPEPNQYKFETADEIVAFAKQNQIAVRGHTLVWHRSMPAWLEQGKWDKEQLKDILRDHIHTVVSHYKGSVVAWDVVNEAINDDGSYRENLWYKTLGPEYIELAFRYAHEADPQALLFYNDYTNESMTAKSTHIYEMVKQLKDKQVPIHGVGWQMHLRTMSYASPDKVKQNLKRLSELGVQVQITEMDVKVNDNTSNTMEQKLKLQADVYAAMLSACLSEHNCTALLTWGVADKHSYIREQDKTERPLLFDDQYKPKPAYKAILDVLERKPLNGLSDVEPGKK